MAGIQTPFAAHHSHHHRGSYDGTPSSSKEQPNSSARQQSNALMLDESFDLPSYPSLDDFLMHATQGFMDSAATAAAAKTPSGRYDSGTLPRIPSRLLTMSTAKSLSAMASLDLSWLGDGPSAGAQQAQQGGDRKPSLALPERKTSLIEELMGPEQLGSTELPSVLPLDIGNGVFGAGPTNTTTNTTTAVVGSSLPGANTNRQEQPSAHSPLASPSSSNAAEAAAFQLYTTHTALVEAQATYLKVLAEVNNNPDDPSKMPELAQVEQIAAAQQHLAMHQSYFAAALLHAQQFQQQQTAPAPAAAAAPFSGLVPFGATGVPASIPYNRSNANYSTPYQTRASAMAQWEQERALMQALNSSDMETSVQAFSGILSVAGGGGSASRSRELNCGPCGVPQNLPNSSSSIDPHNGYGRCVFGSGALPFPSGDGSAPPTPSASMPTMTLKISNGAQPMVCVTHSAQPIKVSCNSAPSSPMRVEQNQ